MDSEASTEPTPARAHTEQDHYEAVVIGGGQAGLATAFYLLRAGVDTLVLDDQPAPGGAWRHVWPSLRLFSTAGFSNLPARLPADTSSLYAKNLVAFLPLITAEDGSLNLETDDEIVTAMILTKGGETVNERLKT